jgi:hypothetical protein
VLGAVCYGVKRLELEADGSPQSSEEVKNDEVISPLHPKYAERTTLSIKYRMHLLYDLHCTEDSYCHMTE